VYAPAEQVVHDVLDVEKVPTGQAVQFEAPDKVEYVPGRQVLQAELPPVLYVPAPQSAHSAEAPVE
jgi:hypothetical protein